MSDNYFTELSNIDVSNHVKQKGQFGYLSWPFAIQTLGENHPDAEIEVKRFHTRVGDNYLMVPYLETPLGYFVEVIVTINGTSRSQIHPVIDYKNQPIMSPTVFDINTSLQRALVKAIALHGLGLFIYQGEDLPLNAPDYTQEQYELFQELLAEDDAIGLYVFFQNIPMNAVIALNGSFEQGNKTKMKELVRKMEEKGREEIERYQTLYEVCIENDDKEGLLELAEETGEAAKALIWSRLTHEHQHMARDMLR